ncbi:SDR family NAD(P)-dependent oxidoreductase [Egibacter rhizosphaerae]|uniref:SDR family NAD(P)-dependent oxidoreductase n=1 Tax=Egibacter rhizosphaerae TaxID=1670831 RepID=A0A411YIR6_9ACTN|nr:SDR family NAD(P)-dependent oxidoreductase [Egibacter rhizosphaerae]QBI20972.1 SDR family NAD(P)-dependent oxidoreductase [Egibacter rhizosphaerae]
MELDGKIAVVTGASSGLGEAVTLRLAEEGMTVYAVARRAERLDGLATARPPHAPGRIVPHPADVTSDDDVRRLAARVRDERGACHVLVNSAGAVFGGRFRSDEDRADVEALMDLNFGGTVRCMGMFARLLADSAPSRVVNVASVAGKLAAGPPGYPASKFATVGFTEAVGPHWARRGVEVSQLNPGFVRTEGFPQVGLVGSWIGRRLVIEPADVAEAVVDVARRGTPERTVPRWYRLFVVARHVAAPAIRFVRRRVG